MQGDLRHEKRDGGRRVLRSRNARQLSRLVRRGKSHSELSLRLNDARGLPYAAAMSLSGFDHLDNDGDEAYGWLEAKANEIAGGSNEVQLNILAKRVLGFPQD